MGTKRIILWIEGTDCHNLPRALEILEKDEGHIEIFGVTGTKRMTANWHGRALPYIPVDKISGKITDYVVLTGGQYNFAVIASYLARQGLGEGRVFPDRAILVPGFSSEKYRKLQSSNLSIISLTCFGGILCHRFGLPFRSPFINMFWREDDFIRMLEANPKESLQGELTLKRTEYEQNLHFDYPVFDLNGFEIHMNHYPDFEEATRKWRERLERINWDNLFVVMNTARMDILERFDRLPFLKKACVVPFESNLPSAYSIRMEEFKMPALWMAFNAIASGTGEFAFKYDYWDMLLFGRKTRLKGN